jgi:signal transduction histidine kinase
LSQFRNGRFRAWTTRDGLASDKVFSIHGDRAGNLWIATFGAGLNRFRDGRFTLYTQKDGLAGNDLTSLYEDRAGSLWIGSRSAGVSRWQNGRFTTWATKDGQATRNVESFYMDQHGTLWIGTRGDGLCRFKDGKFVTITRKDGLHDDTAYQILSDKEDDSGDLWMSCNKGIYRVSLKELNEFADGRRQSVTSFAYGVADGMLSRECNGGQPAGWKTRDGRLWFPTLRGVVALDPQPYNPQPSRVVIEGATLAGATAPLDQPLRIEPGQENLEIQYTALNWGRPQQIRFKYQMAELHQDWIEAGARRTAYFSYMPPGDYTFKVIADNGEGVWNGDGQSLRITVLPPFYRTWWFRTLALLMLGGSIFAAFQYRVRQLDRARVAQERFSRQLLASQEHERQRIASELHDSLGQSLLIIKNRAWLALSGIEDREATAEQLREISDSAARAVVEARAISYNLRPYQLERFGLTKTLQAIVQQAGKTSGIRFEIEIDEIDGLLTKDGEINLYRIVQEILNNIIKHSQATEARLTIRRDEAVLRLLAQDNGQGIGDAECYSPQKDSEDEASLLALAGGFGLIGMAERARILGGSFTLNSSPGAGMTINITLPIG